MRIALGIEYDGSLFYGWQQQPYLRTVQHELQKAIRHVANHPVQVQCAGRTDTGVHATSQVIHFDTDASRHTRAWVYGVNSHLPNDIAVLWSSVVDENFHARYSAISRHYRYFILNHPIRPSLATTNITWQYRPLDHAAMHEAAQVLVGEHDFSSFRAIECQSRTPMRNLTHISVERQGDMLIIDVKANAFLHHMIRNIVGVLVNVGSGKRDSAWVKEVLEAKDRTVGAETAPPYGLYLVDVHYPESYALPVEKRMPLFFR